ncbi:MAG TPA: hypothetical protein VG497_23025 [Kribbella sp.]|nr:hypothetical protein [Kribbella sp.]
MKRFVVPPDWPIPPRRNWIPPKPWHPDPSWPPAPPGWRFWVNGRGRPVLGPVGRYGGPSRRAVYAGAAALIVFAGVNIWAVSAIGLFGGESDDSAAVKFAERTAPPPSVAASSTSPLVPRTTVTPPRVPSTIAVPTVKSKPTRKPTAGRTTAERTKTTPKPTRTTTRPPTPKPTWPTAQPSTSDELLRQYCIQHGIDPAWCDPSVWQRHP